MSTTTTTGQRWPHLLTLDASLRNTGAIVWRYEPGTGWVIVNHTVIRTSAADKKKQTRTSSALTDDLHFILDNIQKFRAPYRIDAIGAEVFTGGTRSTAATRSLALVQGLLVTFAHLYQLPLLQIDPDTVKRALGGSKNASKRRMMDAAVELYPRLGLEYATKSKTSKSPYLGYFDHVADAVGVLQALISEPQLLSITQEYNRRYTAGERYGESA